MFNFVLVWWFVATVGWTDSVLVDRESAHELARQLALTISKHQRNGVRGHTSQRVD